MQYNLTNNQKELARWIWREHSEGNLTEVFDVSFVTKGVVISGKGHLHYSQGKLDFARVQLGTFEALADAGLIKITKRYTKQVRVNDMSLFSSAETLQITILGQLELAVTTNFAESETRQATSNIAQWNPPEITLSLDRLRERYPDSRKLGFLIMRFVAEKPYAAIVDAIQQTATEYGLTVLRADSHDFHTDLLSNVRTYLHGCGFGIAVYERIQADEPNANVGLEVGYLMAMNKPVLLLKDKTMEVLQTDLAGRLYKTFDTRDPDGTIPRQLTKWLEDYGIIVGARAE